MVYLTGIRVFAIALLVSSNGSSSEAGSMRSHLRTSMRCCQNSVPAVAHPTFARQVQKVFRIEKCMISRAKSLLFTHWE